MGTVSKLRSQKIINRNIGPLGKVSAEGNYILQENQNVRWKDPLGAEFFKNQGNLPWTLEFRDVFWIMNPERILMRTRSPVSV
jgi:hypothetical protein